MGPPNVVIDESKFLEIQKQAKKFGIIIPKKFETKTALKDFFISKEFIVQLKTKMNQVLESAINNSNGISDLLQMLQSMNSNSNIKISQKFHVGYGNNSAIVKNVIKQRYWWTQAGDDDFNNVSFMWTSWKQ